MLDSRALEVTVTCWPLLITPSASVSTVGRAPLKR